MPVAVGCDREAGLAAGQQRHAGVVGAAQHLRAVGDFAAKHLAHHRIRADVRTVVGEVRLEREHRHQRRPGAHDGLEAGLVHQRGVQQQVHAGGDTVDDRIRAADMAEHGNAEFVRRIADELQFGARPALHLTAQRVTRHEPGDMHLDPVRAVLDLPADLRDDFGVP
jgi:hypothetical protein